MQYWVCKASTASDPRSLRQRTSQVRESRPPISAFSLRDISLADPGGRRRRTPPPPPQQDPILSFLHMFLPKSTHVGGRCPPQRLGTPPQREILDPPLHIFFFQHTYLLVCLKYFKTQFVDPICKLNFLSACCIIPSFIICLLHRQIYPDISFEI